MAQKNTYLVQFWYFTVLALIILMCLIYEIYINNVLMIIWNLSFTIFNGFFALAAYTNIKTFRRR